MNTDLLGIKSNGIKQKHSPPLVGRVRRARILRCPIIDFSDPFVFEIIRRGSQIYYLTPLGLESKARKTKIPDFLRAEFCLPQCVEKSILAKP